MKSGQVEIMFKQHGSFSNMPWGVGLCVICEHVPVVSLEEHSVFHKHASWMIQAVLDENDRKAISLYDMNLSLTKQYLRRADVEVPT